MQTESSQEFSKGLGGLCHIQHKLKQAGASLGHPSSAPLPGPPHFLPHPPLPRNTLPQTALTSTEFGWCRSGSAQASARTVGPMAVTLMQGYGWHSRISVAAIGQCQQVASAQDRALDCALNFYMPNQKGLPSLGQSLQHSHASADQGRILHKFSACIYKAQASKHVGMRHG